MYLECICEFFLLYIILRTQSVKKKSGMVVFQFLIIPLRAFGNHTKLGASKSGGSTYFNTRSFYLTFLFLMKMYIIKNAVSIRRRGNFIKERKRKLLNNVVMTNSRKFVPPTHFSFGKMIVKFQ